MEKLEKPVAHCYGTNHRPALYLRASSQMLMELRRLRDEMGVPIRALVINALLCTYPHLTAYCRQENADMARYFQMDAEKTNG